MTPQRLMLSVGWVCIASVVACTEVDDRATTVRPETATHADPSPAQPPPAGPKDADSAGISAREEPQSAAPGNMTPDHGQNAANPTATTVSHRPRFSRKSAVYDPKGEGFNVLQSPSSAMQHFPADSLGNIDWVRALSGGLIKPRMSVKGRGQMRLRTDDVIMRNTRDMPWVRFPHRQHTEWLDCSNCHPRPFEAKNGSNQISMESIMRGQHCGMCHDRVAFSIFACERCHSVLHEGSPAAWW